MANRYLHLIDRTPAYFNGEQLLYAHDGITMDKLLVKDMRTVRRQQQAAVRFRRSLNWPLLGYYSCMRIRVAE